MASKLMAMVRRNQRGMTTAEYAVGSVAVATAIGVGISIIDQQWFQDLIKALLKALFDAITSMLTGGM
jgi:Flp pilus assembly pilin Flp